MPTVTIEVAHVTLLESGVPGTRALERSCVIGDLLVTAFKDVGITPTVGVLVDDKQITTSSARRHAHDLLQIVQRYLPVTYACSERLLGSYKNSLLSLLDDEDLRRRREDNLDHRLARYGTLPCSVDIALWHLLRVGEIADRESLLRPLRPEVTVSGADVAISVLPETVSDPERIADRDWLRHLEGGRLLERVRRFYFPVSQYHEWSPAAAYAEAVELAQSVAERPALALAH
jgi:hypothetical protein